MRRWVWGGALASCLMVAAADAGVNRLDLTWFPGTSTQPGDAPDGFIVERATTTAGPFTEIARTGATVTTYADTGLPASATRCYRIKAFNTAGTSNPSPTVCGTTDPAVTTPQPPQGLSVR